MIWENDQPDWRWKKCQTRYASQQLRILDNAWKSDPVDSVNEVLEGVKAWIEPAKAVKFDRKEKVCMICLFLKVECNTGARTLGNTRSTSITHCNWV